MKKEEHNKYCIIIPVYNNAPVITDVIKSVIEYCHDIIVVNDGSTDLTEIKIRSIPNIEIVSYPTNMGKGYALRKGLQKALSLGYTHAVTFDGDGQHLAKDIPLFIQKSMVNHDALLIGKRIVPYHKSVEPPARSSYGRKFGNFWYRFFTGISLDDTQCGFRCFPINSLLSLNCKANHYEWEQEVLIRYAWSSLQVKEVDIHIYYQPKEEVMSHFRPFRDFMRITRVNAKAGFMRTVLPQTALEAPGSSFKEKLIALFRHELKANTTPKRAAASLAFGVFMAIFPIHGFQVISLMGLSYVLKLNRPLAFLGVSISSAPFIPFIIFITVNIGRFILPQQLFLVNDDGKFAKFLQGGIEFILGSIILSFVLAAFVYIISLPIFSKLNKTSFFRKHK